MRAIREAPLHSLIEQSKKFAVFVGRGLAPAVHRTELWNTSLFPQNLGFACRGGNLPPANERTELWNQSLFALTP